VLLYPAYKAGLAQHLLVNNKKVPEMKSVKNILVVDDDQDVREFLISLLTELNYHVLAAASAEEAIEKYNAFGADIVISDMVMGAMGGLELLDRLYAIDEDIAFLLITGYPSIDTAVKAIKKGAYDYITKPFNIEEMKIRIEKALQTQDMKKRLKKTRGFVLGLLFSIPVWICLGIMAALFFYRN
jgi:DNA-binding NtrC family response regulator